MVQANQKAFFARGCVVALQLPIQCDDFAWVGIAKDGQGHCLCTRGTVGGARASASFGPSRLQQGVERACVE